MTIGRGRYWGPVIKGKIERSRADRRKARDAAFQSSLSNRPPPTCLAKGCDKPPAGGPEGWFPCCSKECHDAWQIELERAEERREARRQGIPVAELRKNKGR